MGHLQDNGFDVDVREVSDTELALIKSQHGVPRELAACHTGTIDGYVIEGHVPADVIKRLLQERPEVAGLSVPGMPAGAPGMEGPPPVPYDVLTFDSAGRSEVYERR